MRFNARPTTLGAFSTFCGTELIKEYHSSNHVLSGFLDGAESYGFQAIPTLFSEAPLTAGVIEAKAYEYLRDRLLEAICREKPDGVLLFLHGAAVAEGYDSSERDILRSLSASQNRIPLVVACDFHANLSEMWVKHSDAIVAFKTSPHVDMSERGLDAAKIVSDILAGGIHPRMQFKKLPILIKGGLMTIVDTPLSLHKSPFFFAMRLARQYERMPEVINVSICAGFGDADVPHAGLAVLATTNDNETLGEQITLRIGESLSGMTAGFLPNLVLTGIEDAIDVALSAREGPVILADEGDNAAGGGPADGTFILKALRDSDWPSATLIIKDPEFVAEAIRSGVDGEIVTVLGGKSDRMHGEPVPIDGKVKLISGGGFYEPLARRYVSMRKTAVIEWGETDIIVTEKAVLQTHPSYFESVGVNLRSKKIIVVKSAQSFRVSFEPLIEPKMIMEVDTPGVCNPNPHRFEYKKVRRPIFPLDKL